jgi:hypothetical protein
MTDESAQRIRLMRYELYSRAVDALRGEHGADLLPKLAAEAHGCRRASEAVELAEFHVAFRFPKRGIEHFVRQFGRCFDCQRPRCVADEEAREASPGADAEAHASTRGGGVVARDDLFGSR